MASGSIREKLVALAFKFTATLDCGDMDAMMALRTDSCLTTQCCPSFSTQPRSNEEIREYFREWQHVARNSRFRIIDESNIIVDEVAKKIAFRAICSADTIGGPYENENFVILQATDDCALVDGVWEFFDAVRKQDLLNRLAAKQVSGGLLPWCVDDAPDQDEGLSVKNEPKAAA